MSSLRITAGTSSQDLMGGFPDENGCVVRALAEGTQWGAREPLTEVLTSMMRHGSLRVASGSGNRAPTINLVIEGPTLGRVADTEQRLQRDFAGVPALLEWQPDHMAEPCVFELVWSDLRHEFDDWESRRLRRGFTWEFDALPFARAKDPSHVSLDTGEPAVMFDGSTASGWSSFDSGITFGTAPGGRVTMGPLVKGSQVIKTLPAAASVARGDYILVTGTGTLWEWVAPVSSGAFLETLRFAGIAYSDSNGVMAAYGPASRTLTGISSVWLQAFISSPSASITSVATSVGLSSGRQALMRFDAGGSAPTYGDIHVHDSALGQVMLHVGPDREGFTPPLSPWMGATYTTAEVVIDSTTPSGRSWILQGPGGSGRRFSAEVPAVHFPREGSATLWAKMLVNDVSAPVTINWSASSFRNSVKLPGEVSGAIRHRFTQVGVPEWVPIREIPVPPTAFAGVADDSFIQVAIGQPDTAGVEARLHEAALTPVGDDYSTIVVDAGAHSDLWIEAPSIDRPAGATWIGDDGDRDNAFHAGPLIKYGADAVASFSPGWTRLFLATDSAGVSVDVEWYERYHDHATKPADPVA